MNPITKILPADVAFSPYEEFVYNTQKKGIEPIVILLIALLVLAAIITIIVIAVRRSKKKNRAKIEEKEKEYELDTEDTTR